MGPEVELVGLWLFQAHPEQTLVPSRGLWPTPPRPPPLARHVSLVDGC